MSNETTSKSGVGGGSGGGGPTSGTTVPSLAPPNGPPGGLGLISASVSAINVEKTAKDFASTHRVKKLLETYTMTAERSLMGPNASEDAFNQQKYFSGHGGNNGGPPFLASSSASSYKLPPDVELSKTSPSSADPTNHGSGSSSAGGSGGNGGNGDGGNGSKVDIAASRRLQMQMISTISTGLKGGGPMSPPPPTGNAKSSTTAGNGLVTLSRYSTIDILFDEISTSIRLRIAFIFGVQNPLINRFY